MDIEKGKIEENRTWKVFEIGLVSFLIGSIFPFIMTILFLLDYIDEIKAWAFRIDIYGDMYIVMDFSYVITYWIMISIPLMITAMITKRILYNKKTGLLIAMPPLAFVISFLLGLICFFVIDYVA
jgi:hypothetical protein